MPMRLRIGSGNPIRLHDVNGIAPLTVMSACSLLSPDGAWLAMPIFAISKSVMGLGISAM